jgi:putative endonuclease
MKKPSYVYIMANARPTIYVGVTVDLIKRVYEHNQGFVDGFTKQYGLKKLVYYEVHESLESSIAREKQLKNWRRQWKLDLIEKMNPNYDDLYPEILNQVQDDVGVTMEDIDDVRIKV